MQLAAPVLLTSQHDTNLFHSGEALLDEWLQRRALLNMQNAASRTYVLCPPDSARVIGFYALAMGQIQNKDTLGSMRRNMPEYIPAVVLGRLAIDAEWQHKGLGGALLHNAVTRSRRAADYVSARLLIVHALNPGAEAFYQHYGFARLPVAESTLALDLIKVKG